MSDDFTHADDLDDTGEIYNEDERRREGFITDGGATPCCTPEGIVLGDPGFEWPCGNPQHDHEERSEITGRDVDKRCADCGHPCHYDYGDEQYHHDDPETPACFLIGGVKRPRPDHSDSESLIADIQRTNPRSAR